VVGLAALVRRTPSVRDESLPASECETVLAHAGAGEGDA
jgi:hypothetical protein